MRKQGGKIKTRNRLWSARKRRNLRQKQVALLLGKTIQEISRYETGSRVPELYTLLALEVIYKKPLHTLFPETHKQVLKDLQSKLNRQEFLQTIYADLV